MPREYVVGLFQSKGTAEDAVHRLHTEGVPNSLISLIVLHDVAPLLPVVSPPAEALTAEALTPEGLTVDPLLVGDIRNTFAPHIRNGETAVFVEVASDVDVEQAVYTIRQYSPIKIRIVVAGDVALVGRDVL